MRRTCRPRRATPTRRSATAASRSSTSGAATHATAGSASKLHYRSPAGAFPRIRAHLRFHPQDPTRVQLKLRAKRGGFAALAPELPLWVIVQHDAPGPCAKAVYRESTSQTCTLLAGGARLRCQ